MRRILSILGVIGTAVLLAQPLGAAGYSFTVISHPSAPNSTAVYGINNLGQIVGSYTPSLFSTAAITPQLIPAPTTHGFLYDNGSFTTIDAPAGGDTEARGINDSGTIVGASGSFSFGIRIGFVNEGGVFTNVTIGSSPSTVLRGIDNVGLMVGSWSDTSTTVFTSHGFFGFNPAGPFHDLDYPGALTSALTGVNNLGAVTGLYALQVGPPTFGYISIGGEFGSTGPGLEINGINDSFAFGGSFNAGGVNHGFVYANGVATVIDVPGRAPRSCTASTTRARSWARTSTPRGSTDSWPLRTGRIEQRLNTRFRRGMGAEETHQSRRAERLDDEHVRRGRVGVERHRPRRCLDLPQRVHESAGAAGNRRAAGVGVELARARDGRLNHHRRDRAPE